MEGYERVTVVKFRVNYGGDNGAGCFEVKLWADTAKYTDVIVARLRDCSDLIREGKVFVENETKVASGVGSLGCSERAVLYFRELLFKSNKKKFSFRRVESEPHWADCIAPKFAARLKFCFALFDLCIYCC